MSMNPAMSMGFMGGGDDFYTQMMYAQMMNGSNGGWATNGANGWSNGWNVGNSGGNSGGNTATPSNGVNWGKTALFTAGSAGAAYAGTNWLNHGFNSPVEEVNGKIKFTDDFMAKFSDGFASTQNESALKNFYTKMSTEVSTGKFKHTVNAQNFDSVMDEIKLFLDDPSGQNLADLSDDAKGFLKTRLGKDVIPSGTTVTDANRHLYELVDSDLDNIRKQFSSAYTEATELGFKNNYNLQKSVYDSYDDFVKGLADCTDDVAKAEYLRANPHHAGLSADDLEKLMKNQDVDTIFQRVAADASTRKTNIKTSLDSVENAMQNYAKKWDMKAGWFGKGKFNLFKGNKMNSALDDALSAMRKCKGGKYALIAGVAVAGASLLFNA